MIKAFLYGILQSFYDNKQGLSARKLTAFSLMICVFYVHWNFVTSDNSTSVLIIDLLFISLLFGLIHAKDIIEFWKNK